MKHHTHLVQDIPSLTAFLALPAIRSSVAEAMSVLVQVFSAEADPAWILSIVDAVTLEIPEAILVGASTMGEVLAGRTLTGTTVLSLSCFASTSLVPLEIDVSSGEERQIGLHMGLAIHAAAEDIAGALLLATPLSLDTAELVNGLSLSMGDVPVFGGGAADHATSGASLVFHGRRIMHQGVVAVVFSGKELRIELRSYLGWQALSNEMTITEVEGRRVLTVDDAPAFDVYRRYLDIANDDQFFINALEFPFLLERNGEMLARVPMAVDEHGALLFVADIQVGEKFRVGYGNPAMIVADARAIQQIMRDFVPQAVLLYTCVCRRYLMQHDVELETLPFEAIAPTAGFYTYGEFLGKGAGVRLLNSTMVVVGLREGPALTLPEAPISSARDRLPGHMNRDHHENRHTRVVSRLMHFIGAVTSELEQANRELFALSITDKLTQVYNRVKLDAVLNLELNRAQRYHTALSVVLLDLDHFKQVNDEYGHNAGDTILVRLGEILRASIRACDVVGRWGGEEFLLILPATPPEQAREMAEKLRLVIASTVFTHGRRQTASFGVSSFHPGDSEVQILARADEALYQAKRSGRNQVVLNLS